MIYKARDSRSCTYYEQNKCSDTTKSTPKYIRVELQEMKEDREILKVARGMGIITFRGKNQTITADFLRETVESNNFKLSVVKVSTIFVRNEDSLLIHPTSIPTEEDTKGRKSQVEGEGFREEKKQQKCVGKYKRVLMLQKKKACLVWIKICVKFKTRDSSNKLGMDMEFADVCKRTIVDFAL